MIVRPRELPGREVVQSLQKLEWRYRTLQRDFEELSKIEDPASDTSPIQHRFTNRERLHEAERRLHHYLSGFYTFKCLVTTLAESAPNPECTGRLKNRRDTFADKQSSRIVLGMRHYVQHHNVLPVLVKNSVLSTEYPKYAINVDELKMVDANYRVPQMTLDLSQYDDGYEYFYEGVEGICIYPFEVITDNWSSVEDLRDGVYSIVRDTLEDELTEYVQQLKELERVRDELRQEHDFLDEMLQEMEEDEFIPSMRDLLTPEIHDRIADDEKD